MATGSTCKYTSESYHESDVRQAAVRHAFNEEEPSSRIVPLVRTPDDMIRHILRTAKLEPHDHLCDLGSGDGRVVIIAAQEYGVQASGLEISDALVLESRRRAREHGVEHTVSFNVADMFSMDPEDPLLTRATVFFLHLMPEPVERLRRQLEAALERGARIVTLNYHLCGAPIIARDRLCPALVCRKMPGMPPPHGYVTEAMAKWDVDDAIKKVRLRLAGNVGIEER